MIGFLDCYSGISGDMLLGAIVDAGLPIQRLKALVGALRLGGDVSVWAETVDRGGLRATRCTSRRRGPAAPDARFSYGRTRGHLHCPSSVRGSEPGCADRDRRGRGSNPRSAYGGGRSSTSSVPPNS